MKSAIVIEGGALRGVHTSGVLDVLMKNGIFFPYVIGVSAGALNAFNYVSGQPGRSARINLEYIRDERYFSLRNIPKQDESAFNFDFMFNSLGQIIPFDYETFYDPAREFIIVATDMENGKPVYFKKSECENIFKAGAASASLPLISPPVTVDGHTCLDGGVVDPVPVLKAIEDGNEKVVVILTRHKGYRKKTMPKAEKEAARRLYKDNPEMLKAALDTNDNYNRTLDIIDALEEEGRIFVIRPSREIDISFLERDTDDLGELYRDGLRDGEAVLSGLCEYLGIDDRTLFGTDSRGKYHVRDYISARSIENQTKKLSENDRPSGSAEHEKILDAVAYEIQKSGLDVYRDPNIFTSIGARECALKLHIAGGELEFKAVPLCGSGFSEKAVTAELCFLDDNKSHKFINSRGKIAVISLDESDFNVSYNIVADKDFSVDKGFGCPHNSSYSFLRLAKMAGVKGLICIWKGDRDRIFDSSIPSVLNESGIPAVWISQGDGERLMTLKNLRQASEASLFIGADVFYYENTQNIYCMIKGEEKSECVIVACHTDGNASENENSVASAVSLIRCLKEKKLYRNHIFVFASHTAKNASGIGNWLQSHRDLWDGKNGHMKAVASITAESLGFENEIVFSSNTATDEAYLRSARRNYALIRAGNTIFGDGKALHDAGIPVLSFTGDRINDSFDSERMLDSLQTVIDCLTFFEEMPKGAIGKVEKASLFDAIDFGGKE